MDAIMDTEDLRLTCLKLAVYLAKQTEDDALVLAQEFLAFVTADMGGIRKSA
jgi:hypothetical protein